jgi:hypothetical protein
VIIFWVRLGTLMAVKRHFVEVEIFYCSVCLRNSVRKLMVFVLRLHVIFCALYSGTIFVWINI